MKTLKINFSVFLFLFTIILSACSDDEDTNSKFSTTSETLNLLENRISVDVPQSGAQHTIFVNASDDVTWKVNITDGEGFITVTPFEGQTGNGEITIQIEANSEFIEREGSVSINNSLGGGKVINFTQEAKIDKTFHFAVMGDLHYGLTSKGGTVHDRVPASMQYIAQNHPDIKALFLVGDVTDSGTEEQFSGIKQMVDDNLTDGTKAYFMMGNHDLYQGNKGRENFQKITGQSLNQYIERNGYPFITLSLDDTSNPYYKETSVNFLKVYLAKAAETYPGKPIFVFAHVPPKHTTWGDTWECTSNEDLHNELSKYPQVIFFTGHTHFTIEDERSITQNKYTWINAGPSHYAVLSQAITPDVAAYRTSGHWINEALVVDVDEASNVTVTRLNTREQKTINKQWIIKAPHDGSQFKYTAPINEREDKDSAPVMSGVPTVSDVVETTCKVTFQQGTDDVFVYHYKVDAIATATNEVVSSQYVFSEFYWKNNNEPTMLSCDVSGLTPNTKYKISVKAVDSFESESEAAESTEFTTKALPEVDPSVQAPTADLIDVVFSTDGAKNKVTSSGLAVTKQGTGTPISYNSDIKMYVTKPQTFGSTSNFYMVNYKNNTNYVNGVKDGFTWEIYCKASDITKMQYPMSNLQGAGMGFCFNETYTDPKGATFCAMVRGENGYHKIPFMDKTEVKANTYYHLLFTWDGAQICTYKNGAFVSSTACNVLKMPGGDAQYICIGADSGNKPTDQAANGFNGEVAIARVYDKAVTASEVASLYNQLGTRAGISDFNKLNSLLTEGTLSATLSAEGWALMNNLATTEAEVKAFIAKVVD